MILRVFLLIWCLSVSLSAAVQYSLNSAYLAGAPGTDSEARSLKRLSSGDLIVGGNTNGVIGSGNTNKGSLDWFFQRLAVSSAGVFTVKWTKMLGSTGSDHMNSIAIDGNDNVYAAGYCSSTFDGNTYFGGTDICYAKFDANGNKIWSKQGGGGSFSYEYAYGILVDSSQDYFYIVGNTDSNVLYGTTRTSPSGYYVAFLTKYNSVSGENTACHLYGPSGYGHVTIFGGAIDSQNNIYFVGTFQSGSSFMDQANIGGEDAMYIKVASDGSHLYSRIFGGSGRDKFRAAAVDDDDNIYFVSEASYSANGFYPSGNISTGAKYATSSQGLDIALVKISPTGAVLSITLSGGTGNDYGQNVEVDSTNNLVFVTGVSSSVPLYGDSSGTISSPGATFLMVFSTNGTRLFSKVLHSTGNDVGNALVADSPSEVYIAGYSTGSYETASLTGNQDLHVLQFVDPDRTMAPTLVPTAIPSQPTPEPTTYQPTVQTPLKFIKAISGSGAKGFSGDNGSPSSAALNKPNGLWMDSLGNIFVVDSDNHRVRKISATTNTIFTVAGSGSGGFGGDGGPAMSAQLYVPEGVWVSSVGVIYIADTNNCRIRNVTTSTPAIMNTFAGTRTYSNYGYYENCGSPTNNTAATSSKISNAQAITGDSAGTIYISDTGNNVILKVSGGIITVFAGMTPYFYGTYSGDGVPATSARLKSPQGLWLTTDGSLLVADSGNHRIRSISLTGSNIIRTVMGDGDPTWRGDGGSALNASLDTPTAVCIGMDGAMFVADGGNHRIRVVDGRTGIVSTHSGRGNSGPATSIFLNYPTGIALDSMGNLFVADQYNDKVHKLSLTTGIVTDFINRLNYPQALFIDTLGDLFIADRGNNRVLKIEMKTNTISTVMTSYLRCVYVNTAGVIYTGSHGEIRRKNLDGSVTVIVGSGSMGSSPDGTIANASATIGQIQHVFVDSFGTIYFADIDAGKIRTINPTDNKLGTFAGNGNGGYSASHEHIPATSASLNFPAGFWFDSIGNAFIADHWNNRIRKVTVGSGIISTVAGGGGVSGDGGNPLQSSVGYPWHVVGDNAGNLYVTGNFDHRVRKIDLINNIITTVMGYGMRGAGGIATEGSLATSSFLSSPQGLIVDSLGSVYFTDEENHKLRMIYDVAYPTGQPSAQPTTQPSRQPTAPTSQPTAQPTSQPSQKPISQPTTQPTADPSAKPSHTPTSQPSSQPSDKPLSQPTVQPTSAPSSQPTSQPTAGPSSQPSQLPSSQPTTQPTSQPSSQPTYVPSSQPTSAPSAQPSSTPTSQPSHTPTGQPTPYPSSLPSCTPTTRPTSQPSNIPTTQPAATPTSQPTSQPAAAPTSQPTSQPTSEPSSQPSKLPSSQPSTQPSPQPTSQPTAEPSSQPSHTPTVQPTSQPTAQPSSQPSQLPSSQPSSQPTSQPTTEPSSQPSHTPTTQPTSRPSNTPTTQPTAQPSPLPSSQPTYEPTTQPTSAPSPQPSHTPTSQPTSRPTREPSNTPTTQPTTQPTSQPSSQPTYTPITQPTSQPTLQPSSQPTSQPSLRPTAQPTSQPTAQPSSTPTFVPSVMALLTPTAPTVTPSVSPSVTPIAASAEMSMFSPAALDALVLVAIVLGGGAVIAVGVFFVYVLKVSPTRGTFKHNRRVYVSGDHVPHGEIEMA